MREDAAYALTRRRGKTGTITRITGTASDPETGAKTPTESVTTIRWMFKQPTAYSRLLRADATQQRIGETTFIIWLKDVTFTRVSQSDYITYEGIRYEVLTSTIEDTGLVITANEFT